MATIEEKQKAHNQLQEAIDNILIVFESFDPGTVTAGWVLAIAGSKFQTKEDETYEDGDSELETLATHCLHYQDGQHPYMSRGIAERTLDRLRG